MAEIQHTQEAAYALLESAARKFKAGDKAGADRDRMEADGIFEAIEAAERKERERVNALYGENRNFGIIYSVIEENVTGMMKTQEGRKHLGRMLRAIKRTPELKKQFALYEALTRHCPSEHSEEYVSEVMRKLGRVDGEKILEQNNRLLGYIQKAKIDEMVEIDDERCELYENIEKAMLTNDRLNEFSDHAKAKKAISEAISRLPQDDTREEGKSYDELVESICGADLSDEEMLLVMEIRNAPDKEALFLKYKGETLKTLEKRITETKDESQRNYLNQVYATIDGFEYSPDTVCESVAKMAEIESIVSE